MRPSPLLSDWRLCIRCGWSGEHPLIWLNPEGGGESILMEPTCPQCGRDTIRVGMSRQRIARDIITTIRETDLSTGELQEIADVLADKAAPITAGELVQRVPAADAVIKIAVARGGRDWLAILAVVVTLAMGYIAHLDAEKATRPSAEPARTSQLSDEDIAKIAAQVDADLEQAKPKRQPHARRQADRGKDREGHH